MHILSCILLISLAILGFAPTAWSKDIKQPEPYELATDIDSLIMHKSVKIPGSKELTIEKLSNSDATSILLKASNTDQITWLTDTTQENKLIRLHKTNVIRAGNTLTIKTLSGRPVKFRNMYKPERKTADGDSTKYFYAGMLASTGYHMVEAVYMHDSPGRYFVNSNTGSMLYANISEHSVFLSNKNKLLVVNGSSNPPFGLVLTSITEQRHKIELHCLGNNKTSGMPRISFKGWLQTADEGFALVLSAGEPSKQNNRQQTSIPIQFKQISGAWHVYAAKNQIGDISKTFTCWQPL